MCQNTGSEGVQVSAPLRSTSLAEAEATEEDAAIEAVGMGDTIVLDQSDDENEDNYEAERNFIDLFESDSESDQGYESS